MGNEPLEEISERKPPSSSESKHKLPTYWHQISTPNPFGQPAIADSPSSDLKPASSGLLPTSAAENLGPGVQRPEPKVWDWEARDRTSDRKDQAKIQTREGEFSLWDQEYFE